MQAIGTLTNDFQKVYTNNVTDAGFTARVDTATEPTGDGVIELAGGGKTGPNTTMLQFFAAGSDGNSGSVRVFGVAQVGLGKWHYALLFAGTFTLSSVQTGVSGGHVGASELYADTIARTVGVENVGDSIISPADDSGSASLLVDNKGFRKLKVDLIKGNCTSVNATARGV